MTNNIIVLEYARIDWRGEYVPIQYVPVDSIKTAEKLAKYALNEYKGKQYKVRKKSKRIWEIEKKNEIDGTSSYYYMVIAEKKIIDEKDVDKICKDVVLEGGEKYEILTSFN